MCSFSIKSLSIFELVALVFVLLANSWKLAIIGVGVMAIAITPVTLIRKKIKNVTEKVVDVLEKTDVERYRSLIERLGLRK